MKQNTCLQYKDGDKKTKEAIDTTNDKFQNQNHMILSVSQSSWSWRYILFAQLDDDIRFAIHCYIFTFVRDQQPLQ